MAKVNCCHLAVLLSYREDRANALISNKSQIQVCTAGETIIPRRSSLSRSNLNVWSSSIWNGTRFTDLLTNGENPLISLVGQLSLIIEIAIVHLCKHNYLSGQRDGWSLLNFDCEFASNRRATLDRSLSACVFATLLALNSRHFLCKLKWPSQFWTVGSLYYKLQHSLNENLWHYFWSVWSFVKAMHRQIPYDHFAPSVREGDISFRLIFKVCQWLIQQDIDASTGVANIISRQIATIYIIPSSLL